MFTHINDYFLGVYKDANYVLQQKARIIFILLIIIFLCIPAIIIMDLAAGQASAQMLITVLVTLAIVTGAIFFLKSGKFAIASHTALIIPLLATWAVLFFLDDSPYPICRLDTIVYIPGIMVLLPLVIARKKFVILIYTAINTVLLALYVQAAAGWFNLDSTIVLDFFVDNAMFIVVVGLIGYQIYKINKNALDRAQELTDELELLNRDLEKKVEERTRELNAALEEMEALNKEVIEARDSLWSEMELAKKIQTILLPDQPRISGFEIAAYMKPAVEVGGDYYDIINVKGYDWLVIGDVSGHGVPAGLIMMMVQTSIHTVLETKPDAKPSELLVMINSVIYQNIKKLGEDKYMTITVFSCIKDGRFYYSGLHQDIMIFRSARSSVEIVETNGMWIGLDSNLQGMVDDCSFTLDVGDTMLVYTDGITEAMKTSGNNYEKDSRVVLFGQDNLAQILSKSGTGNLDTIKTAILDGLTDYECNDDVTFMAVRRLQ
ncbi:MAG: SpoIIE family protein phosphatase [Spirochaetes bacterium]|nr:SpoIIE family protein phosphatase [Spirochaetota bacterium]